MTRSLCIIVILCAAPPRATAEETDESAGVGEDVIFEERNGLLAVEAEHFFKQTHTDKRRWRLFDAKRSPKVEPDGDPPHLQGASGGAYLEILPDTRRSHDDKLIHGENFSNTPGRMGVLYYKVKINTPGRYYIWARIYSTTTEDNGLHVGLDGQWPDTGRRMQWTAKNQWFWDSKQRTEKVHTGVPGILYLDIDKPGEHIIMFSMREDGAEFDKWLMTTDKNFKRPKDAGPKAGGQAGEMSGSRWTGLTLPLSGEPRAGQDAQGSIDIQRTQASAPSKLKTGMNDAR